MVKWQPPQLRTGIENEATERRATWLELFYDLIYVATIASLAHQLHENITVAGFLEFFFIFIPVWWSWVGVTFYATRFGTDDLGHRLLTLLQMMVITALTVNIPHALTDRAIPFALCYVATRLILIAQYLMAAYFIPVARPLAKYYALGFSLGASLWLVSIFVPSSWRWGFWLVGLAIDLLTPLTAGKLVEKLPPDFSHIPERVGLFTIIVLGESVVGVVRGLENFQWGILSVSTALLGMAIAFSLWWIYFETVDGSPLRAMGQGKMRASLTWLYCHLPLTAGITAAGVGIEKLVSAPMNQPITAGGILICTSVALCLFVLAMVHQITCSLGDRRHHLVIYRLVAAVAVLLLGLGSGMLLPIALMAMIAVICISQVIVDL